jgi:Raf kinase inhibitor-like YbhB/YbcL family protein
MLSVVISLLIYSLTPRERRRAEGSHILRGTPSAVFLIAVLAACSAPEVTTMELTSSSFAEGASIPSEHTCDGADTSPPLKWSAVPDGTESFALIVDDPDARGFVHWVLTDIPADARELQAGEGDSIGTPGPNSFGRTGWAGPCPPSGEHHYVFTLYALPGEVAVGTDADAVRGAAEAAALGRATLTGVYSRR